MEKKLDGCKISNRKQKKNSCPLQKQYQLNERQRNKCEANERLTTTQTYDDLTCWFVTPPCLQLCNSPVSSRMIFSLVS